MTSNASSISTIGAVIMVTIWIVIISLIGSAGIFKLKYFSKEGV